MRPVARDDPAQLRIDHLNAVEAELDLLPDHLQLVRLQRASVKKLDRHTVQPPLRIMVPMAFRIPGSNAKQDSAGPFAFDADRWFVLGMVWSPVARATALEAGSTASSTAEVLDLTYDFRVSPKAQIRSDPDHWISAFT